MKIHELLDSPEKWTQGAYARDCYGDQVFVQDENVIKFCLVGACERCYGEVGSGSEYLALKQKIREEYGMADIDWNDAPERTYEDVINLCKELDI